jgi:dTMP kinase
VQESLQPTLTFWFDLPAELAAERRRAARSPDRFEQLDTAFFERVRRGYENRAEQSPQRFARVDAAQSKDQVWAQMVAHLEQRGW